MNETPIICPECKASLTVEQTDYFTVKICESCLNYCDIQELPTCCLIPRLVTKKLLISNGTFQVRNQCENCGFVSAKSIGGLSTVERESLPVVDLSARQLREEITANYRQATYRKVSDLRHNKQKKEYHEDYLQSSQWRQKRLIVLTRDKWMCQSCFVQKAVEVHHLTYEHIKNEPLFDLVSVCRKCHDAIEEMKTGISTIKITH